MNPPLPLLALVATAGALAIAGCGGGDASSSTTTSPPLSKVEFIRRADALCRTGNEAAAAAAGEIFTTVEPPTGAALQQFAEAIVPALQKQVDGIAALSPPAGDEDQVQAIVDAVQEGIDKVEADPSLLAQSAGSVNPFARANTLAKQYGLKVCGAGS